MSRRRSKTGARALDGLNADDPGVALLARAVADEPEATLVSVCSGAIAGKPSATQVVLDIRERGPHTIDWTEATPLAGKRVAVVWPRAHLGKDFAQQCLARAGLLVGSGGKVLCAVRKQKGADSLADFMGHLFGEVRVEARDKGYRCLASQRTNAFDEGAAHRCLAERYTVTDDALGDLELATAPGVFSRQRLDAGTRQLIGFVAARVDEARFALDLCAGWGPLGLWVARRFPRCEVACVESNLLACQLLEGNAVAAGLGERVSVVAHDGLPSPRTANAQGLKRFVGRCQLAVVNPPTHLDPDALGVLLGPLAHWLAPGSPAFVVANRPALVVSALRGREASCEVHQVEGYGIVEVRFGST